VAVAARQGRRRGGHRLAGVLLPRLAAVAAVGLIDATIWRTPMPRGVFGLCDETAHAATAALLLAAWPALRRSPLSRDVLLAALAAAVLIDLDHVPSELFGSRILTDGTNRPYGHAALTVAVAALAGCLLRHRRAGRVAWGVAIGVALHLVRDMPTGGAPLWWPVARWPVDYPYPVYLGLLLAAAAAPAVYALRRYPGPGNLRNASTN